jgi:hypothetical protein
MAAASATAMLADTSGRAHPRPSSTAIPPPIGSSTLGLSSALGAASLAGLAAARGGAGGLLALEFLFGATFAAGLAASGMTKPSKATPPPPPQPQLGVR